MNTFYSSEFAWEIWKLSFQKHNHGRTASFADQSMVEVMEIMPIANGGLGVVSAAGTYFDATPRM